MPRHNRLILRSALAILPAALLVGCVSDGPPPRPKPRGMPQQPANVIPTKMAFTVGNPQDKDNNNYIDTIDVVCFIYGDTHPISLVTPGSFEFRLADRKGVLIRRWVFDSQKAAKYLTTPLPGPAYAFPLSLVDSGTDVLDYSIAEINCTFTPDSPDPANPAAPVDSGRGHTVSVGRLR